MEGDPRHVQEVVEALGLDRSNPVATPYASAREDEKAGNIGDDVLDGERATTYRAVAARLNYLSLDRPDIRYATTMACAAMSKPTERDWTALKRIGRFLRGKPRAASLFRWQRRPSHLEVYSDSDWAGDRATRRSMSGGCILNGGHVLKAWAKGQQVVALSLAEAELYAGTRAATEGSGAQSLMQDLGGSRRANLNMDSTAALALNQREGLGRAKHIRIQDLWMQEAVREKRLSLSKVPGEHNPADLFTKGLPADRMVHLMRLLGYRYLLVCRISTRPDPRRERLTVKRVIRSCRALWGCAQQAVGHSTVGARLGSVPLFGGFDLNPCRAEPEGE